MPKLSPSLFGDERNAVSRRAKWKEECGIFGIFGHERAAYLTYLGIYALQHRGQESAGIVATDGKVPYLHREEGLVSEVFNEKVIATLKGNAAIGHVRYSTSGKENARNVQPLFAHLREGWIAVAHNGNLVDAEEQRKTLEEEGAIFQTSSDTEIILHHIARSKEPTLEQRVSSALSKVRGAYSLLVLSPASLIIVRDPMGFRPLVLGELDGAAVAASETCAFDLVEASYKREVEPGELVVVDERGVRSHFPWGVTQRPAPCVFEHVYFSRPDSIVFGRNVNAVRKEFGRQLALEHPVQADLVVPVPDSGVPAAIGFSEASGIPFDMAIIRSHYIGRTFIQPSEIGRHFGVRLKLNPVRASIAGKRLVVIDDSLVRGTTAGKIIAMLRNAGANEVHLRISSPPIRFPCVYGIDTPTKEELVASSQSVEQIRRWIAADSLAYLSQETMVKTAGGGEVRPFCTACFDGSYLIGTGTDTEGVCPSK